jgi:hypothetical protein
VLRERAVGSRGWKAKTDDDADADGDDLGKHRQEEVDDGAPDQDVEPQVVSEGEEETVRQPGSDKGEAGGDGEEQAVFHLGDLCAVAQDDEVQQVGAGELGAEDDVGGLGEVVGDEGRRRVGGRRDGRAARRQANTRQRSDEE